VLPAGFLGVLMASFLVHAVHRAPLWGACRTALAGVPFCRGVERLGLLLHAVRHRVGARCPWPLSLALDPECSSRGWRGPGRGDHATAQAVIADTKPADTAGGRAAWR